MCRFLVEYYRKYVWVFPELRLNITKRFRIFILIVEMTSALKYSTR